MDILVDVITSPLKQFVLYPFTVGHILVGILVLGVIYLVGTYLMGITWFRWLYGSILLIGIASMWHQGKKGKVVSDVFKLAMV